MRTVRQPVIGSTTDNLWDRMAVLRHWLVFTHELHREQWQARIIQSHQNPKQGCLIDQASQEKK